MLTLQTRPNLNSGPIIKPNGEKDSSTAYWIIRLFQGDPSIFDECPPQWHIDVRDNARLHVIALTDPSCNGQRFFSFAKPFDWNDILEIFRQQNPGKTFLDNKAGYGRDLSEIPNEDVEALLRKHYGKGFTSLEESVAANTATVK